MKNENFDDIYRKYHRFSVRSARKIVKDRMMAEDVSQEVFLHLYEIRDILDLNSERMIKALIFTATVNKAKDFIKKPWKRREHFMDDEITYTELYEENMNPERIITRKEDTEYKKRVLIRLRHENPVNYDILIKVVCFDIPSEIVAEEYGITRNNVNNRILRTRKWMKKELEKLQKKSLK